MLETKLRASSLPGENSGNQIRSLVLIFYILINSARLFFCKARVVSPPPFFFTCGPVLDLTDSRQIFSLDLQLQKKQPKFEGLLLSPASMALGNQRHVLKMHPYVCLSLPELNSSNQQKFTNSFIDRALSLVISQTPIPATNSTLIQATDLV